MLSTESRGGGIQQLK